MSTTIISVFEKTSPLLGRLALRPMDPQQDTPEIYRWVTQPYARYWGMLEKTYEAVLAEYTLIHHQVHACALIGSINGKMAFLCECYDPAHDIIGNYYTAEPGDVGMHILMGPPQTPIAGFTWEVFTLVMDFLFENPRHQRVVVEPDINNEKIHRLNRRAGFIYQQTVQLPHKVAALAFCTREQYIFSKQNN